MDKKRKTQMFFVRCNDQERDLIRRIAERLNRTESDAFRVIVQHIAKEMDINDQERPYADKLHQFA